MVWRAFPVSRWQLRWMNMHGLENYHFQIYKPWVILGLSGGIVMALQLWNQTSKKKQWIGGPTTNVYQLCCQDFSYHFLSCKPSTNWAVYFLRMGSLFFQKSMFNSKPSNFWVNPFEETIHGECSIATFALDGALDVRQSALHLVKIPVLDDWFKGKSIRNHSMF